MNEINVIEEKFTRCPQCRSFSVKVSDDLSLKERARGLFLPLKAFQCSNCAYRYVEFDKFSNAVKNLLGMLYNRVQHKWLIAAVPLLLIAVTVAWIWLIPHGNNGARKDPIQNDPPIQYQQTIPDEPKTTDSKATDPATEDPEVTDPHATEVPDNTAVGKTTEGPQTTETPDTTINTQTGESPATDDPRSVVTQTSEDPKTTEGATHTEHPEAEGPKIAGYIVFGNSNRFGVNWSTVKNGVRITRLSDGPLKKAGIQLGDILVEVDGQPIRNGNQLLEIRDRIFSGRIPDALLKVIRDQEVIFFSMVKERVGIQEPAAQPPTEPVAIKVFNGNILKIRSSAPDKVSAANRWCFLSKEVAVQRGPNQRVILAGDRSGKNRWAVDDQLIINGKLFNGIAVEYDAEPGMLPESAKLQPLDLTSMVPPQKKITLKLELTDHGKMWGNTDIYILVL